MKDLTKGKPSRLILAFAIITAQKFGARDYAACHISRLGLSEYGR